MKKYIFSIAMMLAFKAGFSQTMTASIGIGTTPNSIKIYLKPSATIPAANISTLQFNVGLPSTIVPAPSLSIVTNNIAGVSSWIIDPPYVENGYWNYNIQTASAGYNIACTANTEFQAMELSFSGGPSGTYANTAHLVTLPDGGALGTSSALFLCTGLQINSNGQALYHAHDANVIVANGDSYFQTIHNSVVNGPLGTFTSYAKLVTGVVLPVKFLSFTAVKVNDNGKLNWTVDGETSTTDRYEVERSFNGLDFTKFATVAPKNNGQPSNAYELSDVNVSSLRSSGIIYYRVRQVDKDGKFTYTEVRSIRLNNKGIAVNVYPNPVKDIAKVTLDLVEPTDVIIRVNDAAGKQIEAISLKGNKGLNIQRINMSGLAAGVYQLNIIAGTETKTISVVKAL
jgi:Secretion system C-terminal sorting domain